MRAIKSEVRCARTRCRELEKKAMYTKACGALATSSSTEGSWGLETRLCLAFKMPSRGSQALNPQPDGWLFFSPPSRLHLCLMLGGMVCLLWYRVLLVGVSNSALVSLRVHLHAFVIPSLTQQ